MKRGKPLQRRTPLARGTKPLARPRAPQPRKMRRSPMDKTLRAAVYARSGGRCDACGTYLPEDAWQAHHRQLRGMGNGRGADSLGNLVALHAVCHRWVHDNPADARTHGFIVPSWANPDETPVHLHRDGRWALPGARWTPTNPPNEGTHNDG